MSVLHMLLAQLSERRRLFPAQEESLIEITSQLRRNVGAQHMRGRILTLAGITEEPAPLEVSVAPVGVTTAIKRALLNCMEAGEVCSYLEQWWNVDPYFRNDLFARLNTLVLRYPDQRVVVRDAFTRFMSIDEGDVAPSHRAALDATIRRLVQFLPAAEQVALAPQFLMHRRAARRQTGAFMVGNHPEHCPHEMKQILLKAYAQRHDPEVLVPLSRISTELSDIAHMLLTTLSNLHDPQGVNRRMREQARVFERLVTSDLAQAIELAEYYPTAFVYGVGKAALGNALPYVMDILTSARQRHAQATRLQPRLLGTGKFSPIRWQVVHSNIEESADCIRLCIWTLGQVRACDVLQELASDYGVRWLLDTDEDDIDENEE